MNIGPLKYKHLKARHPSVDLRYLEEIRALYEGGPRLLADRSVLGRLLPSLPGETEDSYSDRLRRAWYEPVMAEVIDFVVAGLGQDPARLVEPGDDAEPDAQIDDELMAAFVANVRPPGGCEPPMTFHRLLAECARSAMLYGRWWTLVDAPYLGPDYRPVSRADQEQDGALNAYAIPLDPFTVMDWEEQNGELAWAITHTSTSPRLDPSQGRDVKRHEFRLYTADAWALYVVETSMSKPEPGDDVLIQPSAQGRHPFGRVPILGGRLTGLWAGSKLHSLARELLAESTGMTYAGLRSLFPQLYEFLEPSLPGIDEAMDERASDVHRAVRTPRGPGRVQQRAKDDRAEYIGPDVAPFQHAMAVIERIRSAMFAVTYQMALGADTKGAVIRRSAESKGKDGEAAAVILAELGELLRPHGAEVASTAARVRSPGKVEGWSCRGFESFEAAALQDQIDQAVLLEGVSIPSATYQIRRRLRLVRADLGADATPEVMAEIEKELQGAITQDQFIGMPTRPGADDPEKPMKDEKGEGKEDDEEEDDEDEKPAPPG